MFSRAAKRFRSTIEESADELLCPITLSLPLDPVTAEDGKIYERHAIETWLTRQLRSPATNLPMGKNLLPATQIRNMIERMVKSGALPEGKTTEWKKRLNEQELVADLRSKAEGGDAASAAKLGSAYHYEHFGLTKDLAKAIVYATQAAKAGNAGGMDTLAHIYFYDAERKNLALSLRWASAAVALGCNRSMRFLYEFHKHGLMGMPVDMEEAFKNLFSLVVVQKQGSSGGMRQLALMYANGEGTTPDMDKAVEWMRKAIAKDCDCADARIARVWLAVRGLENVEILTID
jgi:TPR repeat protein